jgi:hypothetical protein
MDMESPLLAAALRYAAAGIAVFPTRLGVRGDGRKEVRPIHAWKEASTTDPAVIRSWWGEGGAYAGAAVCVDCGKSGLVGIDQDVTEGKSGLVEWEKLNPEPTWRVRSPTGGAHDYYRADPAAPVTIDNSGAVAPGVDVRGDGGFLFAPPSIDPRGGAWEWVDGEPDWEKLPTVPPIVAERLAAASATRRPKPREEGSGAGTGEAAPAAPALSGQSSLFAQPSELHDFGPGGGYKTREDASRVVREALDHFASLTEEGNDRSKYLAGTLGVLAGHGVDVFWTYGSALDSIMRVCAENGFAAANGETYARGQAERGLEFGMRERWIAVEPPPTPAALETAVAAAPVDAIDALIGEMLSLDQLESAPPPKFMIHRFLQFDSESWLIGAPGSKKSFVAFDMAARVVRGEPWQGFRTNPADVVFIVAEGASGHGKRVKAWRKRNGPVEAGDRQAVFTLPRPVQARDVDKWGVLVGACHKLGQRAAEAGRGLLVVIDTQARVTVGLKENDNGEMNFFVEAVSAIRRATGACVLTIHHTKKGGGDARGASVIDGAQTTELKVMSDSGKLTARLLTEKQKDVDEHEPVELAFEVVDVGVDEDGEPVTSLVLADAGSVAFKAAWAGSEAGAGDAEIEAIRRHTPLKVRTALDPWIAGRGDSKAALQHWIVQTLVDTAETLGLTQSEVKGVVEEKRGQTDKTTFRRAWQKITEEGGIWSDVIVSAGGQRWTVDRVAIQALESTES